MNHRVRRLLLGISFLFLIAVVLMVSQPSGNRRYHIILSGLTRGRILPFKARFKPYKGKIMGGYSSLSRAIKDTIASFSGDAFSVMSIGSEISGTADAYFTRGEATISTMNKSGNFGVMLISNLEFSFGQNRLRELANIANFPFLSSNIVESGTGQVPSYISPELIFTPGSGLKVGVVGITPPATPDVTAKGNVSGLDFRYPGEALANRISNLRKAEVDLVVLLSLYENRRISEKEWAEIVKAKPDVCIMIDYQVDTPPVVIKDGIVIKTISGYNQTKELDVLSLDISQSPSKIISFSGRRIAIDNDEFSGDTEVANCIDDVSKRIKISQQRVIGTFAEDYIKSYRKECPIGDLIADAMRDSLGGDIAIQNSGGIQNTIKAGDLNLGDLFSILPFDNQIVKMNLSGQDILELFTAAASLKRGVLQVSGCSYQFVNRGFDNFELKSVMIDGKSIVATMSYSVVTNSFLAEGGDKFVAFKNGRNIRFGRQQRDAVQLYIEKLSASGTISLKTYGRIVNDSTN